MSLENARAAYYALEWDAELEDWELRPRLAREYWRELMQIPAFTAMYRRLETGFEGYRSRHWLMMWAYQSENLEVDAETMLREVAIHDWEIAPVIGRKLDSLVFDDDSFSILFDPFGYCKALQEAGLSSGCNCSGEWALWRQKESA